MLQNLAAGSALVALSVLIHTAGLILIAAATPIVARRLGLRGHDIGRTLLMTATVLGILSVLTVEVWTWALAAMFSTIGYGAIVFDPHWRLMTALEGINGFLLIGWSTAFLVRASTRHGPFRKEEHF